VELKFGTKFSICHIPYFIASLLITQDINKDM